MAVMPMRADQVICLVLIKAHATSAGDNLVNEAALFSARSGKRLVTMEEFEKAKDKIMMGDPQ